MCGRVILSIDFDTLNELLKTKYHVPKPHINPYNPRYNITPSQKVVALISDGQTRRAGEITWGYTTQEILEGNSSKIHVNARCETLSEKPTFKHAFQSRRCAVLVTGYYEWRTNNGQKSPFYVQLKNEPLFPIAGIWTKTQVQEQAPQYTCALITTQANSYIQSIHHRMPVILNDEQLSLWLDPTMKEPSLLSAIMRPYDDGPMTLSEVSSLVNNPQIDCIDCTYPKSFFGTSNAYSTEISDS